LRLVRRNRRAIVAIADALAETRHLSGEAIQQIFDANRNHDTGGEKLRCRTRRKTV